LLVPKARLSLAVTKARKYGVDYGIIILSIESFVAQQTTDELAGFSREGAIKQREELVRVYNDRLKESGERHAPFLTLNGGEIEIKETGWNEPDEVHDNIEGIDFVYPEGSLFTLLEEGRTVS